MNNYSITIPLVYNRYELFSKKQQLAYDFALNGTYREVIEQRVTAGINLIELAVEQKDGATKCLVNGVVADEEFEALKIVEPYIHQVCVELTYAFNRVNANIKILQPRIEPDWTKVSFSETVFIPKNIKESKL